MFSFFWKRKKKKQKISEATAPGTGIRYHPELVEELHQDHQNLLNLFGEIQKAHQARDYESLSRRMSEFSSEFRGHLLKENVQLYTYLQHVLANDSENAALMRDLRGEMHDISKAVSRFVKKYAGNEEWDATRHEQFGKELEATGKVLTKRIQTEEKQLYPLYMPIEAYTA